MKKFTTKDPVEKMYVTFDFTDLLMPGPPAEVIVSATWEIKVKRGEDPNASTMIIDTDLDNDLYTTALIQNGVSGTVYVVSCIVTTTEGQILKQSGVLPVKTQG